MISENIKELIASTQADSTIDLADEHIEALCAPWPISNMNAIDNIPIVRDIIQIATQNSEADPMAILSTLIPWFGAVVGSKPHIKIGDTDHPPRIFATLVGASSRARKGTSEKPIRILFEMAEKLANIPKLSVTYGPLSSGEGLIHAVRDPSQDKSIMDLGITDKRLLCIEQEFASVFKSLRRDGNTLSCTIRTIWDGGTVTPLTKSNKTCATDPHICIIGHITQPELIASLRNTETWNGFANRFLWICVRRQRLIPLPSPMDYEMLNIVAQDLADILASARTRTTIGFTPGTRLIWEERYPIISQDLPGALGAITARAEAQVLRLALVFTLLDGKDQIDVLHLQAALDYWQYCSDSARFLFGNSTTDPDVEKILIALHDGPKTTTQLHKLFSGHKEANALKNLLDQLQMTGKIKSLTEGSGPKKGKAASVWSLSIQ